MTKFRIVSASLATFILQAGLPAWAENFVDIPCAIPEAARSKIANAGALEDERARQAAKGNKLDEVITRFNAGCKSGRAKGSDAELACKDAEATLTKDLETHNRAVAQLNAQTRLVLAGAEKTIVARMAQTRGKLANSRVDTDRAAARAGEWVKMGQAEASRARRTLFEQVASLGIDAYTESARESVKIADKELRDFKTLYKESWQAFPPAVRETIANQISNLSTSADVLTLLKYIYEQHGRAYEMVESAERGKLLEMSEKATLGVLKLALGFMKNVSPEVKVTVALAEVAAADVDAWHAYYIAKGSVDQMLSLRDLDLRAIASLADLYRRDTDLLKAIRMAALSCHAIN